MGEMGLTELDAIDGLFNKVTAKDFVGQLCVGRPARKRAGQFRMKKPIQLKGGHVNGRKIQIARVASFKECTREGADARAGIKQSTMIRRRLAK